MIFLTITDNLENLSEKIFLYDLYICLVQTNIVKINYGIMNKKKGWLNKYVGKQPPDIC